MKKLIASCFTEIIFSLKTPSEIYCRQQTMVCQVGCPRHNHKSSIISPLPAPPSFKSGRLPRDSFNWLNLIFCEPLLYSSDRFNFPSPASTHFHIGSSSVMYIFLRVLGALLHSFRHYCISAVRSEGAKIEIFNKIISSLTSPCPFGPLRSRLRVVGMGIQNNSHSMRFLQDLFLWSILPSKNWSMYILLTRVSLDNWKKLLILQFCYLVNTWMTHRKDVM